MWTQSGKAVAVGDADDGALVSLGRRDSQSALLFPLQTSADKCVAAVEGAELIPPDRSTSCLLRWPPPRLRGPSSAARVLNICQNRERFIWDNKEFRLEPIQEQQKRVVLLVSAPPSFGRWRCWCLIVTSSEAHCFLLEVKSAHTHTRTVHSQKTCDL